MRIVTAFVLAGVCSVHAQPGFERIYESGGYPSMVELPSQHLITGMSISSTGTSCGFTVLNPNGNIIHQANLNPDTTLGIWEMVPRSDIELYFTSGYYKDTCINQFGNVATRVHPMIGRIDTIGNVLSAHYYVAAGAPCNNGMGAIEVTNDGAVIVCGVTGNPGALKVSASGVPQWSKRALYNGGVRFIKELSNGDLLMGLNMDTAGAVLARMDAFGSILWCKSYVRPNGMLQYCLIEPDDSFIITGFTDSIQIGNPLPPTYQPKLFMMKLDGAGEVQWCKGYYSTPSFFVPVHSGTIVRATDGNYAVLGTLGHWGSSMYHRPFLMKTDTNGDTLWTRKVGVSSYIYSVGALYAAPDGGVLVGGLIEGDLPGLNSGLPFIFKCDSAGNFPCLGSPHPVQMIQLFPVDSAFSLNWVDVPTVAYPAFTSQASPGPIAVFDACEVANGSSSLEMRRGRPMRIRPNPSTGRFTLEVRDPLLAESYYSVYDALGKLLYQRPLPAGATVQEIDLSRFGPGTYVLRLTDPEGSRHERVVVE